MRYDVPPAPASRLPWRRMVNFRACELHQITSAADPSFIRLVWTNCRIHTMTGHRPGSRKCATKEYQSAGHAREAFERDWQWRGSGGSHHIAYLSPPLALSRRELANPHATTDAHWVSDVLRFLTDGQSTRRYWIQVTGLLRTSPHDPGAAAALAYLQDAPHYLDTSTDTMLAQAGIVEREATWPPDQSSFLDDCLDYLDTGVLDLPRFTKLVCPITPCTHGDVAVPCETCASRLPELLAHQLRGHKITQLDLDHRTRMADTARRLAHRPLTPHA